MKKAVAFLGRLLALSILAAPLSAWAGFLDDDLTYGFESGSETRVYVSGLYNKSATHITIPSTVVYEYYDYNDRDDNGNAKLKRRTCTVTSIRNYAFSDCSGLTSVTIPDSVTSIGNDAFRKCSSLISVIVPSRVLNIGSNAFLDCTSLSTVDVAAKVIGNCAFGNCTSLQSLTLYASVETLDSYAFQYCTSLKFLTIPSTVKTWGQGVFKGCTGLTSASINSKDIGDYAFYRCSGLVNVTIADVESIGIRAFEECSGIAEIEIPNSATNIGQYAFYNCNRLERVSIGRGIVSIPSSVFRYCGLKRLVIPSSVKSIGSWAFGDCVSLEKVEISASVPILDASAFQGCINIQEVDVPQSVLSKPMHNTFPWSYSDVTMGTSLALKTIKFNADVKSIHDNAFAYCHNIISINVLSTNFYMVAEEDGILYNKDKTELILCPKDKTSVAIPLGVRKIWNFAFAYCSNLESVAIPDSVEEIGDYAFSDCAKLASIVIPTSVSDLSTSAFDGCKKTWTEWCRSLSNLAVNGNVQPAGEGVAGLDLRYDLTQTPGDRAIADVTVNGDMALDAFVLKEGKVYDSVLYVHNNADHAVKVTLPSIPLTEYKTFKGATPLTLPAYSTSILTITRVAGGNAGGNVLLVSREELETVK